MKIINIYKQYGLVSLFKRIPYTLIRKLYKLNKHTVYIIANHKSKAYQNDVEIMDMLKINEWLENNKIDKTEAVRFKNFLQTNCIGYYIELNNELGAWGFVQTEGIYQYGTYNYELPENVQMLKNLFVKPNFRGMSLGKKVNKARINAIPNSCIPCGFVIPENRFAIRNLKMLGFKEVLSVSHVNWFKYFTKTRIKVFKTDKFSDLLMSGFQNK